MTPVEHLAMLKRWEADMAALMDSRFDFVRESLSRAIEDLADAIVDEERTA